MGLRTWWNPPCPLGLQRWALTYKLPLIKREGEAPTSQPLNPIPLTLVQTKKLSYPECTAAGNTWDPKGGETGIIQYILLQLFLNGAIYFWLCIILTMYAINIVWRGENSALLNYKRTKCWPLRVQRSRWLLLLKAAINNGGQTTSLFVWLSRDAVWLTGVIQQPHKRQNDFKWNK